MIKDKTDMEPMGRELTNVFRIGKIVFVPHFTIPKAYVGPGYNKECNPVMYTMAQLFDLGATVETTMLWAKPNKKEKKL